MMRATPGITKPRLCRDPLGTEAELTAGPDDYNPYEDPDSDVNQQRGMQLPDPPTPTIPDLTTSHPTRGRDPFVFDDIDSGLDDLSGSLDTAPVFDPLDAQDSNGP